MNQKIRFALALPLRGHLLAALAEPRIVLALLGAGILGVCWEFALTGAIVPGVLGSVCLLVSVSSFAAAGLDPFGLILMAVSLALLALEARFRTRGLFTIAGTVAAFAGLRVADPALPPVPAFVASALFAVPVAVLLSVAAAARRNKLAILEKETSPHHA